MAVSDGLALLHQVIAQPLVLRLAATLRARGVTVDEASIQLAVERLRTDLLPTEDPFGSAIPLPFFETLDLTDPEDRVMAASVIDYLDTHLAELIPLTRLRSEVLPATPLRPARTTVVLKRAVVAPVLRGVADRVAQKHGQDVRITFTGQRGRSPSPDHWPDDLQQILENVSVTMWALTIEHGYDVSDLGAAVQPALRVDISPVDPYISPVDRYQVPMPLEDETVAEYVQRMAVVCQAVARASGDADLVMVFQHVIGERIIRHNQTTIPLALSAEDLNTQITTQLTDEIAKYVIISEDVQRLSARLTGLLAKPLLDGIFQRSTDSAGHSHSVLMLMVDDRKLLQAPRPSGLEEVWVIERERFATHPVLAPVLAQRPELAEADAAVLLGATPMYRSAVIAHAVDPLVQGRPPEFQALPLELRDLTAETTLPPHALVVYDSRVEAAPVVPTGVARVDVAGIDTFEALVARALVAWTGLPVERVLAVVPLSGGVAIFV